MHTQFTLKGLFPFGWNVVRCWEISVLFRCSQFLERSAWRLSIFLCFFPLTISQVTVDDKVSIIFHSTYTNVPCAEGKGFSQKRPLGGPSEKHCAPPDQSPLTLTVSESTADSCFSSKHSLLFPIQHSCHFET